MSVSFCPIRQMGGVAEVWTWPDASLLLSCFAFVFPYSNHVSALVCLLGSDSFVYDTGCVSPGMTKLRLSHDALIELLAKVWASPLSYLACIIHSLCLCLWQHLNESGETDNTMFTDIACPQESGTSCRFEFWQPCIDESLSAPWSFIAGLENCAHIWVLR